MRKGNRILEQQILHLLKIGRSSLSAEELVYIQNEVTKQLFSIVTEPLMQMEKYKLLKELEGGEDD